MQPGKEIGGTTFTGSREQGLFFLGIMGIAFIFGVTGMVYGAWQARTGGRNMRVVFFLIGLAFVLWLIAIRM